MVGLFVMVVVWVCECVYVCVYGVWREGLGCVRVCVQLHTCTCDDAHTHTHPTTPPHNTHPPVDAPDEPGLGGRIAPEPLPAHLVVERVRHPPRLPGVGQPVRDRCHRHFMHPCARVCGRALGCPPVRFILVDTPFVRPPFFCTIYKRFQYLATMASTSAMLLVAAAATGIPPAAAAALEGGGVMVSGARSHAQSPSSAMASCVWGCFLLCQLDFFVECRAV